MLLLLLNAAAVERERVRARVRFLYALCSLRTVVCAHALALTVWYSALVDRRCRSVGRRRPSVSRVRVKPTPQQRHTRSTLDTHVRIRRPSEARQFREIRTRLRFVVS